MNCIKVKRNNLLNSIYSSVSPDFRFKETPYVNFFTDPELSSSLYFLLFFNPTPFVFFKDISCYYAILVLLSTKSSAWAIVTLWYTALSAVHQHFPLCLSSKKQFTGIKPNRNVHLVVLHQSCLSGSCWLHKQVTG